MFGEVLRCFVRLIARFPACDGKIAAQVYPASCRRLHRACGLLLRRKGRLDGLRLASVGQQEHGYQQGVPNGGGDAVERAVSHDDTPGKIHFLSNN